MSIDTQDLHTEEPKRPDSTNEAPQAVVLHTSRFHSVEEVGQWLMENGYDDSQVIPGDEADEPFVAIQFDASYCLPDTAHRDEVEDGVEVVFCIRKEKEENGEDDEENDTPMGDEGNTETRPPDTSVPYKASADAPVLSTNSAEIPDVKKELLAVFKEMLDDLRKPGTAEEPLEKKEPPEDPDEDEADTKGKPYGAQVLEEMHGHLCAMDDYLEEAVGVLEHPHVSKFVGKFKESIAKHKEEVKAVGAKHYPDHFEGADGGESQEPKPRKPRSEEAALPGAEEAANEEEKALGAALLKAFQAALTRAKEPAPVIPGLAPAQDLDAVVQQAANVRQLWYELTGQEI